jgi:hypothetical protein
MERVTGEAETRSKKSNKRIRLKNLKNEADSIINELYILNKKRIFLTALSLLAGDGLSKKVDY